MPKPFVCRSSGEAPRVDRPKLDMLNIFHAPTRSEVGKAAHVDLTLVISITMGMDFTAKSRLFSLNAPVQKDLS